MESDGLVEKLETNWRLDRRRKIQYFIHCQFPPRDQNSRLTEDMMLENEMYSYTILRSNPELQHARRAVVTLPSV